MIRPDQEQALLDAVAAGIDDEVRAAYRQVLALIEQGKTPRAAVAEVMRGFRGQYADTLATALSAVLERSVGAESVLAMRIGTVTLSDRLYAESRMASLTVQSIVSRHAKGWQSARELTLQIFEGYGFRQNEPLRISPRNPRLPKYLRSELLTDPGLAGELSRHFTRVHVENLKTPAMRAAYLEYLDAIEQGRGREVLNRRMEIAFYERMRYHANRIAQSELHRAYAERQAIELADDPDTEFVQIRLSATHPVEDICDFYAHADLYGLGPGVYPKDEAPMPSYHPFCRCIAAPLPGLRPPAGWRKQPGAEQAWLRAQDPAIAARIMGSRAKRDEVLKGAHPTEVWNRTIGAPRYQVRTLAEVAREPWTVQQFGAYPSAGVRAGVGSARLQAMNDAFDEARSGGKNQGLYLTHNKLSDKELARSVRSFEKQIDKHQRWIADPTSKIERFYGYDPRRQRALLAGWEQDILRHKESIEIVQGILREREE